MTGECTEPEANDFRLGLKGGVSVLLGHIVERLLCGGHAAGCESDPVPRQEDRHREKRRADGRDKRPQPYAIFDHCRHWIGSPTTKLEPSPASSVPASLLPASVCWRARERTPIARATPRKERARRRGSKPDRLRRQPLERLVVGVAFELRHALAAQRAAHA